MSAIQIIPVKKNKDVQDFIKLPYKIYKNDPWWVPPLENEIRNLLTPEHNNLLKKGPYQFIIVKKDGIVQARIGVGIDYEINEAKDKKEGYLTLFETTADYEVARNLLDYSCNWLKKRGIGNVTGPISPTRGDDYRGMLVKGFGSSPVLLNPYNPPYYPEFFERYGFEVDMDFCAYYYDLRREIDPKLVRGVNLVKQRYNFRVDSLNINELEQELNDIKVILDEAMPEEWEHIVPPSLEELHSIARPLLKIAEPGLINIARQGDRPIGFALALPDYNQIFKKIKGKLFPFGFLKILWHKHKITGGRIFVMFIVPDFHKKGVSAAIYLKTFQEAKKLGYIYGEGSQIGKWNKAMRRDAEGVGGIHYKTYRFYKRNLT